LDICFIKEQRKKETKEDLDQVRDHLERCIENLVHVKETQEESVGDDCKKISEEAKQLHNASLNYNRGLSKAALGDFAGRLHLWQS
jgi:response regulator RpfG family c-di-GMP phosphodiesterase